MFYSLLLFFAFSAYLLATILIARMIQRGANQAEQQEPSTYQIKTIDNVFIVALLGALAHFFYAINVSLDSGSINLSLSSMTCLVSLALTIIFLTGSLALPIRSLGVLVFPLTALSLVFSYFWGTGIGSQQATHATMQSQWFAGHIYVSILAYSLIAIATIQSLIYVYQERLIKNRTSSTMLLALPPLQTMEQLLFRLVAVGFALLSLTILSGIIFSQEIFGQAFTFKHHTVFAILSWLVFALLLFRRYQSSVRGSQAVKWVLIGFVLMQLGYFGTKLVSESINIQ